ncbi:MAG TPA: Minf_1886 family protein [Longimicrobiales bacterium]|nr:Minf_1886 family protein [Longimicrobiales bacterium]
MLADVMDEQLFEALRARYPRYSEAAYMFVLSSLNHVLQRLPEPRHISGRELVEGARDLALDRYGPMARSVLEHWGIHATSDVGEIVFALVEHGVLIKQDEDTRADFADVFDFAEAFEPRYPGRAGG